MTLLIIGSKGLAPIRSKQVKKFTQCRLMSGRYSITIDAGNTFRYPTNCVLVTHTHTDHIKMFHTVPLNTPVWIPHKSFILKLKKLNPRVKFNLIHPGSQTKFKKFLITPFEVQHSRTTRTFGYRIEAEKKSLVWLPDFRNLIGASFYLRNLDYLFINASALHKNIEHKNHEAHGQMAIMNSLAILEKQKIKPKKIYLIHYGIGLSPISVKTEFVNKQFPQFDINPTWDGKILRL